MLVHVVFFSCCCRIEDEKLDRVVFTWSPRGHEVKELLFPLTLLFSFSHFSLCLFCLVQRHLLRMLPLEVWQEVLGFCPFEEYARMTAGSKLASREFYFVLKQSLLELSFEDDDVLRSPALCGLWMASRVVEATYPRVLHLGLFSVC